MSCDFVPAVSQGGHFIRVIPQYRQDILRGRGQVVDIPGSTPEIRVGRLSG